MKYRMHYLAAGALALALLAGCEAAEDAAGKVIEQTKQSAAQIARETVGESLKEFNQQIDQAQESASGWRGEERAEEDDDAAAEPEAPRQDEA